MIGCALKTYDRVAEKLTLLEAPVLLALRLFVANIFFTSAYGKLEQYFNGQWDSVVYLFTDVHPSPFLPPEVAAVAGTGAELVFGTLLALGLMTRLSALGLLGVTAMIELSLENGGILSPQQSEKHVMWALMLGVLVVRGGGGWALDSLRAWLCSKCSKACGSPRQSEA